MANRKISDLAALTTPASGDYLPIVDISEAAATDKNKRITVEELMRGVPSGTAGAPGIAFEADPNTGIYSPGADQIALSTNGTGRLFVAANGDVSLLDNGLYLTKTGLGNGQITFDGSTYSFISNSSSAPLVLGTNSTERLRITSAGLVGVGTGSPGGSLDVRGLSGTTIIRAVGVDTNGNADAEIFSTGTTGNSRLYFSDTAAQSGSIIYSHNTNSFAFATNGSTAATIDASGRLLVGITSAQTGAGANDLLQVSGAIQVVSSTNVYSRLLPTASGLEIIANAYPANMGTTQSVIIKSGTSSGGGPNEIARFTSDGRLLVGTSSDSGGALLQVNGDRIRVATAKTPASASDTGTTGEICWDASYIYVCTATNTWKRAALSTW